MGYDMPDTFICSSLVVMIRKHAIFDTLAVAISAICAIHCLALPVVLVAFPLLIGSALTDEAFHRIILWFIVPTSLLAVAAARRRHPDRGVLLLVGVGLLILCVAAFWAHEFAPPWVDTSLSVLGGLILAIGHIRNFRLCRH
jgi:hypothetical protein